MTTKVGQRTKLESYQEIAAQINDGCMTRDGLTGHGCHLMMHLDAAFDSLSEVASGKELEEAYESELESCDVCE